MATIQDYLNKIKTAVYGKDVRQAIHDAIFKCYEDGKAGSVDLVARENIDTLTNQVAAMNPENNLQKTGGDMSGDINMNGHKVTGLPNPIADGDAVSRLYMTEKIEEYVHSLGLGSVPQTASDLNGKVKTGWWVINETTLHAPSYITLGVCQVISRTSAQVLQIATSTTGIRARRVTTDYPNSWGEWEYENPIMNDDVEYRTTERFYGDPVYALSYYTIESIIGTSIKGQVHTNSYNIGTIANLKRIVRSEVIIRWEHTNNTVEYLNLPIIDRNGSYMMLKEFKLEGSNLSAIIESYNYYVSSSPTDYAPNVQITLYYTKTS